MAQTRSSTHFAFRLAGADNTISSAFRQPSNSSYQVPRSLNMSSQPAKKPNAVGLPTLGDTGIKFNSSRWTRGGKQEGLSVFDVKGAMDALEKGPDEAAKKRAHPAALAHANRVARAQQVGVTLFGFKVFPDLTPGRAFMWGSIFAVYSVGAASMLTARALDIKSMDDIKVKMQAAFEPLKAALKQSGEGTRTQLEPAESPEAVQQLQAFGETVKRALS